MFVSALKYPVVLQKLPEEKVPLGGHCLYYSLPLHQIKGSSLHQRLIVNRIITDNYNYLMVGTQIVVINQPSIWQSRAHTETVNKLFNT